MTDDVDLGDLRCPRCLEDMDVQGEEHGWTPEGFPAPGTARLVCPSCGLVRLS